MNAFLKALKERLCPATLYGMPVERDGISTAAARQKTAQKGIALLIAIMIISVMMLFTSDLILSSQVNMSLAAAERDNAKAEYLAKSAFNAGALLVSLDFAAKLYMMRLNPQATLTDGAGGVEFWNVLNEIPALGGESMEMISAFQEQMGLNAVMDEGVLSSLKLFDGAFSVQVADESSKINVNYCAQGRCTEVLLMLEALMSCPAEKAFLDQKKLSPRELAYRIKDYVDNDTNASEESGFNDEDEPFAKRDPKQRAKNAPFDTPEELRTIEGWDEEVHAVFAKYLTIYPYKAKGQDSYQININTAQRSLLTCLFPESRGDCSEKVALAFKARDTDGVAFGGDGKKMADILRETLCYAGGEAKETEANNKANWFTQRSNVFSIEARGQSGDREKVLHAVIERVMPNPAKNEKASFKILYWKMS